jgi:2-dehydro-3-deoxyphosphogluconate aldolase/(4S)-4-hydroxy-2-oxoglutarate aldolase
MQCVDAGAKFIVSPVFNREIVEFCNHRHIAVFPGGLTPAEIYLAWQAGADAVKVFPCNAMGGASYIRSLKAVFPEIRLFPSGGVTADNLKSFLNAGAFAAGAGTDLVDLELVRNGDTDLFHHRVRRYMQAAM